MPEQDKLVDELMLALANLVRLKIRLPTLKGIVEEFDTMRVGQELYARNDVVLQLVRDSFDMLVIDLASLCEGLTRRGGVFEALAADCARLREFNASDVRTRTTWVTGRPENADHYEEVERKEMAERWNGRLETLFWKAHADHGRRRRTASEAFS